MWQALAALPDLSITRIASAFEHSEALARLRVLVFMIDDLLPTPQQLELQRGILALDSQLQQQFDNTTLGDAARRMNYQIKCLNGQPWQSSQIYSEHMAIFTIQQNLCLAAAKIPVSSSSSKMNGLSYCLQQTI